MPCLSTSLRAFVLPLTLHLPQFVFVSNQVAIATGVLTAMICYVPKPPSSSGARLPTASRDAIPSVPPSATVASSHPASGEYVALSTVGDGPSENGQSHPGGAAADGLASLDAAHARGENGALHKVARVLATDLRIRFVAIFAGLWVLNVVCAYLLSLSSRMESLS